MNGLSFIGKLLLAMVIVPCILPCILFCLLVDEAAYHLNKLKRQVKS